MKHVPKTNSNGSSTRWSRGLRFVITATALSLLAACGGGGGVASTGTTAGTSSVATAKYQGVFVDAKVENLAWRTSTRSGVTDAQGRFSFDTPGELITFSIGGMDLGAANADTAIHVFDLEIDTPEQTGIKGTRLAQLLQTLDTDKNPTNGITLPSSIHTQFAKDTDIQILGSAALWNAKLSQMAAVYGAQPVDTATAYAHASSNIAAASANCVISDRTYKPLIGSSFSTAGMSCWRKAQLAALYDKIIPSFESDINDLLNDPIIKNGEAITINKIKKSLDENIIRSQFQSIYELIDTGVDVVDANLNGESRLKLIKATASFTVPLAEFFAKIDCKNQEQCGQETQKVLIVPKIVGEIANIASCVKGDGPACADALDAVFKEKGLLESFGLAPTKEDSIALNQLFRTSIPPLKAALELAELENPKLIPAKSLRLVGEMVEYGLKMVTGTALMNSDEDYKQWTAEPGSHRKDWDAIGEAINLTATCQAAVLSVPAGGALETIKLTNECLHKGAERYIKTITTRFYIGETIGNAKSIMDSTSDYKIVIAVLQELFRMNSIPEAFSAYDIEFSGNFFSRDPYPDYLTKKFMVKVAEAAGESLMTPFHQNFVFDRVQSAIGIINNDSKKLQSGELGICTDVSLDNLIVAGATGGIGKAKSNEQIGISATAGGVQALGYLISWGDGLSTVSSSAGGVHTFLVPGYYQIKITPYIQGANGLSECTGKRKSAWMAVSDSSLVDSSTINSTPTTPTVFQTISFWITTTYQSIKSVIWNFGADIEEQTANVANGISAAVDQAFTTTGLKTITATFIDILGKPLGKASTTITVTAATLPKADITSANSNSATQPGTIVNNASTDDTTPTLIGSISAPLSSGQSINVYDGTEQFKAYAVAVGTYWKFTPTTPLSAGTHSFTAEVVDPYGTTGPRSSPFVVNVLSTKASITSITPSSAPMTVGDNTTFTVTGQNLPLHGFAVSIQGSTCQSPQYATSTRFFVTCALGNSGNKTFALLTSGGVVIDDSQSITILSIYPGVTTVTPSTATAGVPTTFTVTGQYLPPTAVMSIADGTCQSPIPASRTSNGFTVVCTPGGGAGYKVVTIKSDTLAHGGTVIDVSKTVNVTTSNVQPVTGTFTVVANSYAGTAFTVPAGNNSCAFTAAGTWSFGAGSYDANGYTGTPVPAWADTRMTSVPIGRLVASTPDGFKSIGTASTQAFPAGSVLTFVMNDASNVNLNGYSDNGGSLTVAYSCSAATSSQVYSAANDFSSTNNPNGAWSYGWAASLGQPFQFQNMQKLSSLALDIWSAPNSYPYVLHNGTANQITTHNAIYVPNALGLHPGDQGEVAIVRWTAPTAGTYAVNAKFGGAEAGMANVVVQKNGVTLFQDVKNTSDPQLLAPKTYIGQVSVAAGDTLDFVVGNGGNGYISDSTRLEATLVPCPGGVCPSTLTNSFSDTFDGTSLNTSSWNVVNGTGGHTVSAGEVQLGAGSYAHTVGKKTFSGSKIVIEARFAGKKPSGRDTGIVLVDSSTGDYIRVGDTSYFGWGLFVHGTGALNLTGANNSRGAPTSGINLETNGVSVSTYKVVRVTIEGSTVTVERGDSLNALTEQLQRTLGSSIVGRTFDLRIQTGANDGVYSPGWFDWITVSAQ